MVVTHSIELIFPPIQNAAFSVEFHPSTSLPPLGGVSLLIQLDQPLTHACGTAVGVTIAPVEGWTLGVSLEAACGLGVGVVGGKVVAEMK